MAGGARASGHHRNRTRESRERTSCPYIVRLVERYLRATLTLHVSAIDDGLQLEGGPHAAAATSELLRHVPLPQLRRVRAIGVRAPEKNEDVARAVVGEGGVRAGRWGRARRGTRVPRAAGG